MLQIVLANWQPDVFINIYIYIYIYNSYWFKHFFHTDICSWEWKKKRIRVWMGAQTFNVLREGVCVEQKTKNTFVLRVICIWRTHIYCCRDAWFLRRSKNVCSVSDLEFNVSVINRLSFADTLNHSSVSLRTTPTNKNSPKHICRTMGLDRICEKHWFRPTSVVLAAPL